MQQQACLEKLFRLHIRFFHFLLMQTIYHKKVANNVCPIKIYSTVADQLNCLNNSYQCSHFFFDHHYFLFKDLEALFGGKNTRLAID